MFTKQLEGALTGEGQSWMVSASVNVGQLLQRKYVRRSPYYLER